MTVKSVIEQIGDVVGGYACELWGYVDGSRAISRLAVINMGYADGLSRLAVEQRLFLSQGERVPIVGRVCMDRCIVDITGIPDAQMCAMR
jgi:alanine racemase